MASDVARLDRVGVVLNLNSGSSSRVILVDGSSNFTNGSLSDDNSILIDGSGKCWLKSDRGDRLGKGSVFVNVFGNRKGLVGA